MFACWAGEDLEGMLECADPSLEWHAAADGRLYKGHAGVREFFKRFQDDGQRLEVPLQRAIELAPGKILAVGRLRLMRPGHGLADSPGVWAFHVRRGKVIRIESYRSEREATEALKAAGALATRAEKALESAP
jgi:ketosteroid isomerase-like protein